MIFWAVNNIKSFLTRLTVPSVIALGVSGFYLVKFCKSLQFDQATFKVLETALKSNLVSNVLIFGSTAFFMGIRSGKWFRAPIGHEIELDLVKQLTWANPRVTLRDFTVSKKTALQITGSSLLLAQLSFCWGRCTIGSLCGTAKMREQKEPPTNRIQSLGKFSLQARFDDIFGYEDIKKDFQEIIQYLKNPDLFKESGARLRKGILLYGPSGTGKTTVAKALANEAGCSFLYVSATQFLEVYLGRGPQRVRELFEAARESRPCIVFIDELDALGCRSVDTKYRSSALHER